jgi:hypothetical protein
MLRQCRKCAICAIAVGTACTLCGEVAAAMVEPASNVRLYMAVDAGADQTHDHREPRPPISTAALVIRQATAVATGASVRMPWTWTTPGYRWRSLDHVYPDDLAYDLASPLASRGRP